MGRGRSTQSVPKTDAENRDVEPWNPKYWKKWDHLPGALRCAVFRTWIFARPLLPEERLRLHFAILEPKISDYDAVQHEEVRWMVTHLRAMMPERLSNNQILPSMLKKALAYFFGCEERIIQKRCYEDQDTWLEVRRVVAEVLGDAKLLAYHLDCQIDPASEKHWEEFGRGDWRIYTALGYFVNCGGRSVSRYLGKPEGMSGLYRRYRLWDQLPNSPRLISRGEPSLPKFGGSPILALPFNSSEELPWAEYDSEFAGKLIDFPITLPEFM